MQTIGDRIKQLREARGFTQQDLAALTGLQRGNVSHYERNKVKPSAEAIVQLASFFNVSSDWLLTGREQVNQAAGDRRFAERLQQLRRDQGLTVAEFAQQISVLEDDVVAWESGHLLPGTGSLARIAAAFAVDLEWLVTGTPRASTPQPPDMGLDDAARDDLRLFSEFLRYRRQRTRPPQPQSPDLGPMAGNGQCQLVQEEGLTYLPLLGAASDSQPLLPDTVLEGFVAVENCYAPAQSFAVRVQEAQMCAADLAVGDVVVVQYQSKVAPDEMALVQTGDRTVIMPWPHRSDSAQPSANSPPGAVKLIGRVVHVVKARDRVKRGRDQLK